MVIISDKKNLGLGNRLFVFAHFIANAIEFNYTLSYPYFYEYAHYFKSTEKTLLSSYPEESLLKEIYKPIQGIICYLFSKLIFCVCKLNLQTGKVKVLDITAQKGFAKNHNLRSTEFIELRQASRFLLAKGWLFRDEHNIRIHAESVRRFFRPVDRHAASVAGLIARARKDCDILVGVHIRQGDYESWYDGRYFFGTVDYVHIIRQARELWGKNRVKFLVCSNEKQDERLFEGLNYILGNNHQLEDMYAFAACDYLVGPPSTYTMWASFYGSVPLFVVESLDKPLTLEGFEIIEG